MVLTFDNRVITGTSLFRGATYRVWHVSAMVLNSLKDEAFIFCYDDT
jgi:hypothetical protein